VGTVFDCEIQARLRDVNLGGHVDNVEAVRVLDEARILFLRHAPLDGADRRPGLFRDVPDGVAELVASQRLEYHAEMRFVPFQPFLVRIWVTHVSRTSLTVNCDLRVSADAAPAVIAETALVLFDTSAGRPWPITDQARATFESYLGDPIALRERPRT
jgi:acyl-CoA thioester hydrolase